MGLTVTNVARRAGISPHTVRYYDRVGLLKAESRTGAGYRDYSEDAIERLRFIRDAQRLGLRLQDIRELLEIRDRGQCPCGHTRQLVEKRLTLVRAEIRRLRDIESELERMVENESDAGNVWCCPA
jgi:DNA-binding transcriptional MerR regulator